MNCGIWKKSSYSGQNTECVEAASPSPACTLVRDSKAPGRPWLTVSAHAWGQFVRAISG